ncbi:MAG: hypothetical protein HOF21_13560 [Nitrospina sp.]|jgi:hypothetical protein|nr:hypothetical protein [Nitrospina sp.]MBT5631111.1 hypothetical protein [Nitrospina sp.]
MNTNKDGGDKDLENPPQIQEDEKPKMPMENAGLIEEVKKENDPALKTDSEEKSGSIQKIVTFISLGLAVLAIFFSFTSMKKVDSNTRQIKSNLNSFETITATLQSEMNEKLGYMGFEIEGLKSKVDKSRRMATIMELKRALVTIQEVANDEHSPELNIKSNQLISNIEAFLQDLSVVKQNNPVGTIEVMEAPANVPEKK